MLKGVTTMAEYIEREALIKHIERSFGEISTPFVVKKIKDFPNADVVEVVKVAEILDDAFGNDYPCNFNNIDEWLPYVCEYGNTCDCSSAKCWEQLIKHYGERRCEE
jgi:hypothetical protein